VRGGIPNLAAAWSELKPSLALSYPFELDIFQKEAVLHLEAGRSVGAVCAVPVGRVLLGLHVLAMLARLS
jgi:antiviral helicase SKI2